MAVASWRLNPVDRKPIGSVESTLHSEPNHLAMAAEYRAEPLRLGLPRFPCISTLGFATTP